MDSTTFNYIKTKINSCKSCNEFFELIQKDVNQYNRIEYADIKMIGDLDEKESKEVHIKLVELFNKLNIDFNIDDRGFIYRLINAGFEIDSGDYYFFRLAAKKGHIKIINQLLEDYQIVESHDNNALKLAVKHKHYEVVKILLSHGADVHSDGDWALRQAVLLGDNKIVELLLANGADAKVATGKLLSFAAYDKNIEMIKILDNRGADIEKSIDWADKHDFKKSYDFLTNYRLKKMLN